MADALSNAPQTVESEFRMIHEGSFGDFDAREPRPKTSECSRRPFEGATLVRMLQQCAIALLISGAAGTRPSLA